MENRKSNTICLKLGKTVCKTKIQFLLIKIHEEKLNLPCMCPRNDLLFLCTARLWAWRDFYKGRDDGKHRSMLILSGLSCLRCLQVNKWSTKYSALGLVLIHVALQLSHNYDFITYEDRIFLNRCIPLLGNPDLTNNLHKKSCCSPSLLWFLYFLQIITDAAHGS